MGEAAWNYHADNERQTAALGAALARLLPDGTVIALDGTLGAGKTRLVQAAAESLGVDRGLVVSPTFVLSQRYDGSRTIGHMDWYRIRSEDELLAMGVDELLENDDLVFVEWAARFPQLLPSQRLSVRIETPSGSARSFLLQASGSQIEAALLQVAQELTGK